jgi:ATP-dependent helicase/nuclease subunit B
VWLTRAARVEGTPTVPSRWLLRLDTVLRASGRTGALEEATEPLAWQKLLDTPPPGQWRRAAPPRPRPPVSVRPRKLAVTQVETLIRDPYSIYARFILRLRPLEAIDAPPDAADRGTFIHQALEDFLKEFPAALPRDAERLLLAIGDRHFAPWRDRPELRAFWWPRFERIARWFVERERDRRPTLTRLRSEITGSLTIAAPFDNFVLTAKADRIDTQRDGSLAILDYKTGGLPRATEWDLGYAPQLPLEAAMAEAGAFPEIAGLVTVLEFWRLTGGDPAAETRSLAKTPAELRPLIDRALPGLRRLIAAYDDPATPYDSVPRSEFAPRYNEYAHLARIKEWAAAEGGEE